MLGSQKENLADYLQKDYFLVRKDYLFVQHFIQKYLLLLLLLLNQIIHFMLFIKSQKCLNLQINRQLVNLIQKVSLAAQKVMNYSCLYFIVTYRFSPKIDHQKMTELQHLRVLFLQGYFLMAFQVILGFIPLTLTEFFQRTKIQMQA